MRFLPLRVLPAFLISCFLLSFFNPVQAQQEASIISVKVKVKELEFRLDNKKVHPVWRFSTFDNKGQEVFLKNNGDDCYDFHSKKSHKTKEVDEEDQQLDLFNAALPYFLLKMDCFTSGRKGATCTFDTYAKDGDRAITIDTFKLDKLPPGQLSDLQVMQDKFTGNRYVCRLVFQYTIDKLPTILSPAGTEEINAADKDIELKLPVALPVDNPWQYSIDEGGTWKTIESKDRDNARIKFNPLKNLFNGNLNATKKVLFRLHAFTGDGNKNSEQISLNFTPAPPSFEKNNMQAFSSCPGSASGSLVIRKLSSVSDSIFYVLRKTVFPQQPCNPENTDSVNCPGFIRKGGAKNGGNIRLSSLSPGSYTLQLYNADWKVGKVNKLVNFSIGELAEFKTSNFHTIDPTCTNETGGEASLTVEGGADQLWQIVLTPSKGANLLKNGDQLYIKNLEAGNYSLDLIDQCGKTVPRHFTLNKPKKLTLQNILLVDNATSDNKHELSMQLSLLNGRGPYKIVVTDPDHLEKTLDGNTELAVPFQNAGMYNIKIYDNGNPGCPFVNANFTIVKIPKIKPVKYKVENLTF